MTDYQAPVRQMRFTIDHLADFKAVAALPDFTAMDDDTVTAVLEEAARFAGSVLAPINWLGDQQGVQVVNDAVKVPQEFTDAYKQFCEAGWPGIASNPEFGGQGFPKTVALACDEMWAAANVSFALCPELTQGAILSMDRHATDELKQTYLEKLVSGQWSGTMCLTEPAAGSDLSALTTKAEPHGDHYLISGTKIYITWGDHPMAENIIHLVLARLPDAPPGTKGISLFVVPKYRLNADGTPGEFNDVIPVSVEHKLGIHASPTCVLAFGGKGGAVGYLVGKPNEGLAGQVIKGGLPLLANKGHKDPRFRSFTEFKAREEKVASILCAPIKASDGTILGVINFINRISPPLFRNEDIPFAQDIAMLAALVIERNRLYRNLFCDDATGMISHRIWKGYFEEEAARSVRYAQPLCTVVMDLEKFKEILEQTAPEFAIQVGIDVAKAVQKALRDTDLASRAQDRFYILLPNTDAAGGVFLIGRLKDALDRMTFEYGGRAYALGASAGIAAYPETAPDARQLINLSLSALDIAKAGGRNRAVVHPPATGAVMPATQAH